MSFLDYFLGSRKKTASVAKDRLKLILAHERSADTPDFLPALQEELLTVISKYMPVEKDQISVHMERRGDFEVLELNILFPEQHSPG
ncbi:cell division topological specificity factor MinE [Acidithiobacillus sp. CV18-2]|uniref:Cell division topological specificity factor n=1 Tax=Igneacidithiobacillus copahuensis TaxID=2724909 RepID=A0AAE2YMZ2_9PROT|nr:cell division topological specificity factor MinE [Igneacidithiobacillus copahuensis]MBU2754561.1 cell division topological specificity factor MinE [Acidithiobacillus sp. CV18-3]MBU2757277.1 cell division topological specificity factor MinE [Acidithiobacillus sp. BN09-2]MBU2776846.1 cell division topological specificity factor MinE [Acidithiobacillus sp. CV18-2]MBU2796273.1 cell division topological specificity factor MinE [Acidithiobacillus sp. VAN18-2]MBU2799424.1 cell division topologica